VNPENQFLKGINSGPRKNSKENSFVIQVDWEILESSFSKTEKPKMVSL